MSHRARKRFGQNFLHDPGVIARIVHAIDPKPNETIVEIGPGQGAITVELLKAAREMDAIELDRDLLEPLAKRCAPIGELRLHNLDALKADFHTLAHTDQLLRVVGNLPYNISTPLLFHLLEQAEVIQDMHFMLQREVVDRMAATPGGKDYGRLSITLQLRCRVEPLFDIGPGAFKPAPKVDSAFVRLTPCAHPELGSVDRELLNRIVVQAFSQRRKTLRNSLKGLVSNEQMMSLEIAPEARPETLAPEDFLHLAVAAMSA